MAGLDADILWTLAGIAAAAGILGGILAGLLGIGGGIVIVPALYFGLSLVSVEPALAMQVAVATSLATIVFTSLASARGHQRRGAIDWALLKLWAPSILVGVVLGALLGGVLSGLVMIAVFASVALMVSADMVFRRSDGGGSGRSLGRPVWALFGVVAGAISSLMGIGGGTVCVPLLNVLGYDIRRAVGTSSAIGFLIGLPGALVYAVSGAGAAGVPPFTLGYVNLPAVAVIAPLTMGFAGVGVRLAHTIPRRALSLAFGLFLLVTALRMYADLWGRI